MATNKDSVKKYHQKLTTIRVHIPSANDDVGIPDYTSMIKDRAKELGYINSKGADKGQGSINAYILHLIEKDLGIDMIKCMSELKKTKDSTSH